MFVFNYSILQFSSCWDLLKLPMVIVKYMKPVLEKMRKNCRYRYETDNSLHPK